MAAIGDSAIALRRRRRLPGGRRRGSWRPLVEAYGPIDVLVNNAALATYEAATATSSRATWPGGSGSSSTNLTSVFLCSQRGRDEHGQAPPGAIIHMSSGGASHAHRAMASYDAAKGGIEALTRSMALDLAPYGVRVNFVVPGLIRTYDICDELAAERGQVVPLQRLGTADDMAGPIAFLATDDARYMTGSGVVVDGGVLVQQRSAPVDIFPVSQYPEVPAE